MSFAADVKNELCKAEHSRKQLELLSKGAAFAIRAGGRSPRVAKQFVELLAAGVKV